MDLPGDEDLRTAHRFGPGVVEDHATSVGPRHGREEQGYEAELPGNARTPPPGTESGSEAGRHHRLPGPVIAVYVEVSDEEHVGLVAGAFRCRDGGEGVKFRLETLREPGDVLDASLPHAIHHTQGVGEVVVMGPGQVHEPVRPFPVGVAVPVDRGAPHGPHLLHRLRGDPIPLEEDGEGGAHLPGLLH